MRPVFRSPTVDLSVHTYVARPSPVIMTRTCMCLDFMVVLLHTVMLYMGELGFRNNPEECVLSV